MRREISSRSTIIHKIVTPFIVVVFSIVTLVFVARAPGMSAYGVLLVGLASALFCFPLIWFATKLEHVSIDKTYLYIPRGGEEETIPLKNISTVAQTNWIKPYPIKIGLRESSGGRSSIFFIPVSRGLGGARRHEIVRELFGLQLENDDRDTYESSDVTKVAPPQN